MPADYTYRKETEALVVERADIIKKSTDMSEAEKKIGMGQIEEVIIQVGGVHGRLTIAHKFRIREVNLKI